MNKNYFRPLVLSLLFFMVVSFPTHTRAIKHYEETIELNVWPEKIYRNSSSVLQILSIRRILSRFDENPKIEIEIRHPGGTNGKNWGEELQSWLVSFGIPADYITLFPASGSPTKLVILLLDKRLNVDNEIENQ